MHTDSYCENVVILTSGDPKTQKKNLAHQQVLPTTIDGTKYPPKHIVSIYGIFCQMFGTVRHAWQVQECIEADRAADVILMRRSQFIQSGDTELWDLTWKSISNVSILPNHWEAFKKIWFAAIVSLQHCAWSLWRAIFNLKEGIVTIQTNLHTQPS